MKKVFAGVVVFGMIMNPISFVFAKTKVFEERGRDLALQFIENSMSDEFWKDNNPIISKESFFYTDNDNIPSYIEYKISCTSTPDCGFIMVNVDGDDVAVPISSTNGNTPSEVTDQGDNIDEKNYYFSPFDIYSENTKNGDIQVFDPVKRIDLLKNGKIKKSLEENQANKIAKQELKTEIKKAKLEAKEYKKTEKFNTEKNKIKNQILDIPKEEFSMKFLDMTFADDPTTSNTGYTPPSASNIFVNSVDLSSTSSCSSRTPCYKQFDTSFNGVNCKSGCAPTAVGILYGYYDRNGYSNLIPVFTAGRVNDGPVNSMIQSVAGYMATTCTTGGLGGTSPSKVDDAIQYAKDKGYTNSTSVNSGTNIDLTSIFTKTKSEINAGRPIILLNQTHAMVGFGYSSTSSNVVRLNMGWGGYNITGTNGTSYQSSSIDYNIGSMYYNNQAKTRIWQYVTYRISS